MPVAQCFMKRQYNFLSNLCIGFSENKRLKCVSIMMIYRGRKPNTLWQSILCISWKTRESLQFCLSLFRRLT